MMKTTLQRILALTATTALVASLAACGPDDAQQNRTVAPLFSQTVPQPGWSMVEVAGMDPAFLGDEAAPLPPALPMQASYGGSYDYAPAYDYGPETHDDGYYAGDVAPNDYQWLALASALSGMLGNAPPDYAFGYDGVQPWAWETGDRYLRYAEPLDDGYRYYYYEPDSYTPFLVSDPSYSYGYRGDRLVAIYDRSGRVIDARRAERQRQAAQDYYARARQMYLAAHQARRIGVAAPLWERHRDDIARERQQWDQARSQRQAWQRWDAQNEQRLHRDWAGEALVRRGAERGFAGWKRAEFRTPAPKLYSPQQRRAQVQKVAEIRRDTAERGDGARQKRAGLEQRVAAAAQPRQDRRQTGAVDAREQHQAQLQPAAREQAQSQRLNAQRKAQALPAAQRRQAEATAQKQVGTHGPAEVRKAPAQREIAPKPVRAQHANAQTQAHREQVRQQPGGEAQQRQQATARQTQEREQAAARQAVQREQALRANAQRRQQAAREHQLEAQSARQDRALQAQRAVQEKQVQARQAAERQAQQTQAQARQAAQREARQPGVAPPKPSASPAQQTQSDAKPGKGHGRKGG